MELKFDKMIVDTTLAQDYLNKHKELSNFFKTGVQEDFTIYPGGEESSVVRTPEQYSQDAEEIGSNLKEFAEILKANTNLIAELDYLMRQVPIEDTVAQINVIVKQLQYVACLPNDGHLLPMLTDHVVMKSDSPLLVLGHIAKIFRYKLKCNLNTEGTSAPVCHLFTKLCHDAGLQIVTKLCQSVQSRDSDVPVGAVGVVSEHSDVDSAVDVFLSSSKQAPWSLRKVFVQESVYQQFKDALTWKCDLNKREKPSSSDAVEYDGRIFLIDMVGTTEPQPTAVTVEAYRTRKELKSLLNQHRAHYISLWANDIAEINEIAHSIPSPVVWVNSFGDFKGPPKVSEAIFSHALFRITDPQYALFVQKDKKLSELLELKQSWLRLGREERRSILSKALDESIAAESANTHYTLLKQNLYKMDNNSGQDAFIDIGRDSVCLGVAVPANELFYAQSLCDGVLKSLLLGNAFVFPQSTNCARAVDILRKASAPVASFEQHDYLKEDFTIYRSSFTTVIDHTVTTKVVWTNSGTVFAN